MSSKVQMLSVISFLCFSLIIGVLVFSRGFLLNRQVVPDKAGPCLGPSKDPEQLSNLSLAASWCNPRPPFKKAILVLVDALRYDFVARMSFLHKMTAKEPQLNETPDISSCLFRFVADPPTTTMQRLKALMTGTMPTFIDASANFNSYEIEEDSLVYQLQALDKRIAFLGDDTWLSLFPASYFRSPVVEAHPSFNAWDLDTVDRAINHTLRQRVFPSSTSKSLHEDSSWDVLITHLLGVDHCGHRYGPSHPEMRRKLREADEIVEFIFKGMANDTLLVVFGDHGMTHTGDHGGDSKDETDAAILFLSKQDWSSRNRHSLSSAGFQCPAYASSISQIDLVPTLATLLGTPIPFSSLGQLIPNFLRASELYTDAVAANAAQVERYMRRFGLINLVGEGGATLEEEFASLQNAFRSYRLNQTIAARAKVNAVAQKYLTHVKFVATSAWTQFNVPMIYTGVAISALASVSLLLYLVNVRILLRASSSPSPPRRGKETLGEGWAAVVWLWPSLPLWTVLWTFVQHTPATCSLVAVIVSTVAGLSVFLLGLGATLFRKMGEDEGSTGRRSGGGGVLVSELGAVGVYIATCLAMFSNSFVINEGSLLGCALLFVLFLHIMFHPPNFHLFSQTNNVVQQQRLNSSFGAGVSRVKDARLQSPLLSTSGGGCSSKEDSVLQALLQRTSAKCGVACLAALAFVVRACSTFFRCREELQQCTEEYLLHKQLSSLPEDWAVHKYVRYSVALVSLAVFIVAFRLWMLYKKCLFSSRPAAIVARFVPSLLVVLLGVFWALQGLPFISTSAAKLRPILNYFPWVFQVTTLLALVLIWLRPVLTTSSSSHYTTPLFGQPVVHPRCSRCARRPASVKNDATLISNNGAPFKSTSRPLSNGICNGISPSSFPSNNTHLVDMERGGGLQEDSIGDYSSPILLFVSVVIVLLAQITSAGITPAVVILLPTCIVALVGLYSRNTQGGSSTDLSSSWSAVVAWTLSSQYFFYATGHQPLFSAIPWDSAFLSATADGASFATDSATSLAWLRPALAIFGNLHSAQLIFSLSLPLLVYWGRGDSGGSAFVCHHHCKSRRRKAFVLGGKFLLLHGLKLVACMACAGWQRRHLMVWKIFAPKFIFESISFIVTWATVTISLVFLMRIDYLYHHRSRRHKMQSPPSTN